MLPGPERVIFGRKGISSVIPEPKTTRLSYAISQIWPGDLLKLKTVKPLEGSDLFLLGWAKPLKWKFDKEGRFDNFPP